MTESSNTFDLHGAGDIRNCVGYAIQSIDAGTIDSTGIFANVALGATAENQPTYCSSSIDPWHSAADVRDDGKYRHTGFDLFFTSGITNNLPAMIPVTMLYGTPDDAAAQIAYIEKRGYPISTIEMGGLVVIIVAAFLVEPEPIAADGSRRTPRGGGGAAGPRGGAT